VGNIHSDGEYVVNKTQRCNLCGDYYMSEFGHNYDDCVAYLENEVAKLQQILNANMRSLKEAKFVQSQVWWRNTENKRKTCPNRKNRTKKAQTVCEVCERKFQCYSEA